MKGWGENFIPHKIVKTYFLSLSLFFYLMVSLSPLISTSFLSSSSLINSASLYRWLSCPWFCKSYLLWWTSPIDTDSHISKGSYQVILSHCQPQLQPRPSLSLSPAPTPAPAIAPTPAPAPHPDPHPALPPTAVQLQPQPVDWLSLDEMSSSSSFISSWLGEGRSQMMQSMRALTEG